MRLTKDGLAPLRFDGDEIVDYDFENVNLRHISFRGTTFVNVNFDNASLIFCDFSGAVFINCKVHGDTTFAHSLFYGTEFDSCSGLNLLNKSKGLEFPLVCPEEGGFIGWKKAYFSSKNVNGGIDCESVIVKLFIPAEAKRSSATSRKCRCDMAKVLEITDLDNTTYYTHAHSGYDPTFEYFLDKEVSVNNFDPNRWNECSGGIHFFITREEAVNY